MKISAGTLVSVCRVDDPNKSWQPHVIRRDLEFTEEYRSATTWGSSGAVIFEESGWLILTRRNESERQRA